jgi:hypothetical protein
VSAVQLAEILNSRGSTAYPGTAKQTVEIITPLFSQYETAMCVNYNSQQWQQQLMFLLMKPI